MTTTNLGIIIMGNILNYIITIKLITRSVSSKEHYQPLPYSRSPATVRRPMMEVPQGQLFSVGSRAVNGTSWNFTVLGEGPYKEHCDTLPLTALVLSSYTVPTQKTSNLIIKLRTICKMSGTIFDWWSDLVSDKDLSWRIYIHMAVNTSLKELPDQIFALVSFDLRIRSLKYF